MVWLQPFQVLSSEPQNTGNGLSDDFFSSLKNGSWLVPFQRHRGELNNGWF